ALSIIHRIATANLEHYQSSRDSEQSPKLTINKIPDETRLEIFDSYRKHFTNDQSLWNRRPKWFKLIHVCRKWRRIVLASSTHPSKPKRLVPCLPHSSVAI
ncbi:hypothetical protein BJV74DRAFT_987796, partial [Russula compacta]